MAGDSIASFFEVNDSFVKRRALLLSGLVLVLMVPAGLNNLLLWRVEQSLDVSIRKRPCYFTMPGRLYLSPASIRWHDQFDIHSGEITIKYPVQFLFSGSGHLQIEGKRVNIFFGEQLKKLVGTQNALIDHLEASVLVLTAREFTLEHLSIDSDTLRFKVGRRKIKN